MEPGNHGLLYHRQEERPATPSFHSSPSSYAVSDSGDDHSGSGMAIRTETPSRRYSPYAQPGLQVSSASSRTSSSTGLETNKPHNYHNHHQHHQHHQQQRPRLGSRHRSYGQPSRSQSRSTSLSPALSPLARSARPATTLANGSAVPTNSLQYDLQVTMQPSPAPPPLPFPSPRSMTTAAPVVSFPSLSLPLHPSLAVFQRVADFQRQVARFPQKTVEGLIRPYRNEHESEFPFGILPKDLLDRILRQVDYLTLLRARGVSRACRRLIDPQLADREDKIGLVRDMENRPRNCQPRPGGVAGESSNKGIPSRVGCYFCFTVKDVTLFEAPGNQRHYAIVWVGPRGKVRYEPLSDDDPRIPNEGGLSGGIGEVPTLAPDHGKDTATNDGHDLGQEQQHRHQQHQQWQPSHAEFSAPHNGIYSPYNTGPLNTGPLTTAPYMQQPRPYDRLHNPQDQNGYPLPPQRQEPEQYYHYQQKPAGRQTAGETGALVSLRRYCIECGVQNELYEPRSVFKDWTEKRKLWVCDCSNLPPRERIHEQETEDLCPRCNVRASYR